VIVMGRTFVGSLLFGWGFLVIGANSGSDPYATRGDLYVGFMLVLTGAYLAGTGTLRARARASAVTSPAEREPVRTPDGDDHQHGQRPAEAATSPGVGREMMVGLFVSVTSALIIKALGA
jgi:hypothetical protein